MNEVTRILNAIERGDVKATDELLPVVYEELRLLAAQKLAHESPGQTLQATALVHEAYLRLLGDEGQTWENRGTSSRRPPRPCGGSSSRTPAASSGSSAAADQEKVDLGDAEPAINGPCDDLIALDEALEKLARIDKVKADLVKLRFFAGLTGRAGGQGPGHLPQHGGPLLGLRPLLAAPGDHQRRGGEAWAETACDLSDRTDRDLWRPDRGLILRVENFSHFGWGKRAADGALYLGETRIGLMSDRTYHRRRSDLQCGDWPSTRPTSSSAYLQPGLRRRCRPAGPHRSPPAESMPARTASSSRRPTRCN